MAISELEGEALTKDELFLRLAEKAHFLKGYKAPKKKTELWAEVARAVDSLFGRGLLTNENGRYALKESKPVTVRAAKCEKEILAMLSERSMSKKEIRDKLSDVIGTSKTATQRDDNVLFSYLGQILKRLVNEKTLVLSDGAYTV